MPEFKVTYRLDRSEVFETDDVLVEAESLLEAAQKAHQTYELEQDCTVIAIERRI